MRDRHFPRLCHACQAPMARQEETCWRCGHRWETAQEPVRRDGVWSIDAGRARADIDRWVNEGGRVRGEPVAGRV